MRKDSFERFYYEKIGLGEGCGCAEHVTRIRDLDALGQRLASGRVTPAKPPAAIAWIQSVARRLTRSLGRRSRDGVAS
jgi:hypothetical protein